MSVRERARLLNLQGGRTARAPRELDLIDIGDDSLEDWEERPALPARPSLPSRPSTQTTFPTISRGQTLIDFGDDPPQSPEKRPALPTRPTTQASIPRGSVKARPPVPPKPKSTIGIAPRPKIVEDEPDVLTLVHGDDLALSDSSDDDERYHYHIQTPPREESVERQQKNNPLEDARNGVTLFANNVFNGARKLPEMPWLKPKTDGQSRSPSPNPFQGIAEGFNKVTTNATATFNSIGESKPVKAVAAGTQKAFTGVQSTFQSVPVPEVFKKTAEDMEDVKDRAIGKPGLCSKCRALPLSSCFSDPPNPEEKYMQWATPLSRVLYHKDWCRMCQLFLSMLWRPEFDPLLHKEVAPHMKPEVLKGITMREWTTGIWADTDEYWPFGRGQYRHEGATYVLGPMQEFAGRLPRAGLSIYLLVKARQQGRKHHQHRSAAGERARGRREGREESTKYPLSCVLTVSVATQAADRPGLMLVKLVGYGNHPEATAHDLSQFSLRAVQGQPRDLSYGRMLDAEWIDLSVGKHWVAECEQKHGTRCSEHGWAIAMRKPTFLRVIDLQDLCIVEAANPAECRYIALSYVWGGVEQVKLRYVNMREFTQKGGLRSQLERMPRSILDAMEVVKQLGERYLWIDSMCILQENTKEAHEQMADMDRIYGSALLTIVAADGNDADAGLRGVRRQHFLAGQRESSPRHVLQQSAAFNPTTTIVTTFTSHQEPESTAWNKRAWTFQEKLLSRRLLVFAGDEAIWYCRGGTYREDMPVEDSDYQQTGLDWLALKPQYLGVGVDPYWKDGSLEMTRHGLTHVVRSATFAQYAKTIAQYTERSMTHSSDAINALAGLLHIFQMCFRSECIYGLPTILLDVALLWRPVQRLKRRGPGADGQVFPSWSWAGWVGQVAYDMPSEIKRDEQGQLMETEGIRPLVRWHHFDKRSRLLVPINGTARGLPLDDRDWPPEWEGNPPVVESADMYKFLETPEISDLENPTAPHISTHHLVFWAACVDSFQLGNQTATGVKETSPRFSIVDAEFQSVGEILLDGEGLDWLERDRHEFVVLCECRAREQPCEDEGYPCYLVMLVERDVRTKIASRLGLGTIWKTAWIVARPALKLMCLA